MRIDTGGWAHRQRVSTLFDSEKLSHVCCAPDGVRTSGLWISSLPIEPPRHPITPSPRHPVTPSPPHPSQFIHTWRVSRLIQSIPGSCRYSIQQSGLTLDVLRPVNREGSYQGETIISVFLLQVKILIHYSLRIQPFRMEDI